MNVHARWGDPAEDARVHRLGARALRRARRRTRPAASTSTSCPRTRRERVRGGATAPNYERLATLKAKYDPNNLFRVNQNIQPAA